MDRNEEDGEGTPQQYVCPTDIQVLSSQQMEECDKTIHKTAPEYVNDVSALELCAQQLYNSFDAALMKNSKFSPWAEDTSLKTWYP